MKYSNNYYYILTITTGVCLIGFLVGFLFCHNIYYDKSVMKNTESVISKDTIPLFRHLHHHKADSTLKIMTVGGKVVIYKGKIIVY